MTWLGRLGSELGARGVPRRERLRIALEFEDHIACEPGCEDRLGDPRELAVSFAEELASARTRRSALQGFAALALVAVVLALSQLMIGRAGGYPGFDHGLSLALFIPALVGMFVTPQVALVAGSLAAVRALRRRHSPRLPAAEIRLIERRARVALLAGMATVGGLELYVVNFSRVLPAWYLAVIGGSAAVAGLVVGAAVRGLSRARGIVSGAPGATGDVYDDLPVLRWSWLRRRAWRLGAIGSLAVAALVTVLEAKAERSVSEGLQRGIAEGLVAAAGYALLGRVVGLFPQRGGGPRLAPAGAAVNLIGGGDDQLAGDEDRSRAESILRAGFADGRLGIEELTARVSAVHAAETVGEVRDALGGLPGAP